MFCKFGKERKLFTNTNFRVKYGTIDALKLNSIYIDIESWVQPKEPLSYESYIRLMRRQVILSLNNELDSNFFNQNFIVDLDLRASGMDPKRKSFMLLEVTLYPKIKPKFTSKELNQKVEEVTNVIINTLQKNKFNFNSKKNERNK
jgi:hypothetical protein